MKKIIILCIATYTLVSNQYMFGMLRQLSIKTSFSKKYCTHTAGLDDAKIILELKKENRKLKQENFDLQQKLALPQTTAQNSGLQELIPSILEDKRLYLKDKNIHGDMKDRDIHYGNMNRD